VREVGEKVHPAGQLPLEGTARHRVPADGTQNPDVGEDW
jgi:hypothetical protein